jgi:hypothetical protein
MENFDPHLTDDASGRVQAGLQELRMRAVLAEAARIRKSRQRQRRVLIRTICVVALAGIVVWWLYKNSPSKAVQPLAPSEATPDSIPLYMPQTSVPAKQPIASAPTSGAFPQVRSLYLTLDTLSRRVLLEALGATRAQPPVWADADWNTALQLLESGKTAQARLQLTAWSRSGPPREEEARWLLTLCWLGEGKSDEAEAGLKIIAGTSAHFRKPLASKLLASLEHE